MGGDTAPHHFCQHLCQLTNNLLSEHAFVVFLTPDQASTLPRHPSVEYYFVESAVSSSTSPLEELKNQRNTTLFQGVVSLEHGTIDALITLGHTGFLIAAATLVLPLLPSIRRPGLLVTIPTKDHALGLIDVGGSLTPSTQHLFDSAWLGIHVMYQTLKRAPRVGLLNVGTETNKGTSSMRRTFEKLEGLAEKAPHLLAFQGNYEPRELFRSEALDLAICDGLTGNMFLKSAEGVAELILEEVKHWIDPQDTLQQLKMRQLRERFDYRNYPGATLCGLERLVFKLHGNTTPDTLVKAIDRVADLHKERFINNLRDSLLRSQHLLSEAG